MAGHGKRTPEQRQRMAEAIRRKWRDPDYRARVIAGMREADDIGRPRELPPMTAEQRKRYRYLREMLSRDEALAVLATRERRLVG